jgi:hypothetical protein
MKMNRYQISSPRKAIAFASVALTALTIALAVIVPAKVATDPREVRTLAAITVTSPALREDVRDRVRDRLSIEVVGTRDPELATQVRTVLPKHKQDG